MTKKTSGKTEAATEKKRFEIPPAPKAKEPKRKSVLDNPIDPNLSEIKRAFVTNFRQFVRDKMKNERLSYTGVCKQIGINRQTMNRWCSTGIETRYQAYEIFCARNNLEPASFWEKTGYREKKGSEKAPDYLPIKAMFEDWINRLPNQKEVDQLANDLRRLLH